ncbi:hypothetical protein [uncultured Neglectibacter sp.]|uniref:hypothetical protein n=1 Tax=uncultured Neglectibacter sp. TaxID=1924108 RepID=UPI0034E0559F
MSFIALQRFSLREGQFSAMIEKVLKKEKERAPFSEKMAGFYTSFGNHRIRNFCGKRGVS